MAAGNPDIWKHGFKPGQSGNPSGRPKGIAALAREHGADALKVLVAGLKDDDHRVRIAAADKILDRGYGKAISMSADVTNRLDDMDDAELESTLAAVRESLEVVRDAPAGDDAETAH